MSQHPLKAYRAERGITMSDFAAAAGTTKGTLSRLEAGVFCPSADLAVRLAEATDNNVTVDQIVRASVAARDERASAPSEAAD